MQHGTGLPVPSLCETCRENDAKDAHVLEIISLGQFPAAICSCLRWATTETHQPGDTNESKLHAMITDHARHVDGEAK